MNRIWIDPESDRQDVSLKLPDVLRVLRGDDVMEPAMKSTITERRVNQLLKARVYPQDAHNYGVTYIHAYDHYRSFAADSRYDVFSMEVYNTVCAYRSLILIETPDDAIAVMLRLAL